MTVEEFSNGFDTLLLLLYQNNSFGELNIYSFNEYEKSFFLTEAQDKLVKEFYSSPNAGLAFESNEELRRYLNNIVELKIYITDDILYDSSTITLPKLTDQFTHTVYKIPTDCWYIVYELANLKSSSKCLNGKTIKVFPVTHDTYDRIKDNPFRQANKRKAIRLDCGNNKVEIVSIESLNSYLIRYLRKPRPIILSNLDGLTIDNCTTILTSELPESTHSLILLEAVTLAIASKSTK